MNNVTFAAVLALAALSWGCGSGDTAESAETPVAGAGETDSLREAAPVNVTVAPLKPETLEDSVALAGRLDPWVEVQVSTELGGTVQEVGFDKGRRVQKGQILARIGTDLLEASLREAEAELAQREAEFNKTTELFNRQAVPRQELTSATSLYHGAQARREAAKLRVERSVIRAPVSGMALTRDIELGEFIGPGSLVTTIHQLSKLKAVVGIPEDDIAFFELGANATIEVDAYRGREFEGKVQFLSPAATGKNRTFPAEIALDNRDGALRPGMIVRVRLVKEVYEDLIVVPRDAVLERDTGYVAFVMEGDRAVLRKVETGPSEGGRIVVLDGLQAGEKLILTGHRNLIDGQLVRVSGD